jgi:predicted anti-sigma-YlaC factor YlaD
VSDHPSERQLLQYHLDLSEKSERTFVDEHLLLCPRCQESFDRVESLHPRPDNLELLSMNRLGPPENEIVNSHLAGCPQCSEAVEVYARRIHELKKYLRETQGSD